MLEIRLEIDMKGGRGGKEDEYGREKTGRVFEKAQWSVGYKLDPGDITCE